MDFRRLQWVLDLEEEYDMPIEEILRAAVDQARTLRQSQTEFAAECGVHVDTIRRALRRYGLRWPVIHSDYRVTNAKRKFWGAPLTIDGVTKPLVQWAAEHNMPAKRLRYRIRAGWDPVKALTTPPADSDERARIMRRIRRG